MYTYYVGFGSNMGDKRGYLDAAMAALHSHEDIKGLQVSTYWETEPWGNTDQDTFINGMCRFCTDWQPLEVLHLLQQLEEGAGRTRLVHWGPRTLDLDIELIVDKNGALVVIDEEQLHVPHPYFWDRLFVLLPLAELWPTFTYQGVTIGERIRALNS